MLWPKSCTALAVKAVGGKAYIGGPLLVSIRPCIGGGPLLVSIRPCIGGAIVSIRPCIGGPLLVYGPA